MKLDEKGVNEHGVAMCECGNKPAHAYEPGEFCGERVIPSAADPEIKLIERLRFLAETMEGDCRRSVSTAPSEEIDSTLKMVADFREAADQLEESGVLIDFILESGDAPVMAEKLLERIRASDPMPTGITMEWLQAVSE